MNARIKSLIDQATVWQGMENGYIFDPEKFAELIVQECVGVVEGGSFLHDQAPTAIFARECSVAIIRHFGAEK